MKLVPLGTILLGVTHVAATLFFHKHRIRLCRLGDRREVLHLAEAPLPATSRSVAAASHAAQLPLYRLINAGHRGRIARFAALLRASRRLWGPDCGGTRYAFVGIAAPPAWRCHRLDLQRVGLSRSLECLLPSKQRRPRAGAARRCILPSDSRCAATPDHARSGLQDT